MINGLKLMKFGLVAFCMVNSFAPTLYAQTKDTSISNEFNGVGNRDILSRIDPNKSFITIDSSDPIDPSNPIDSSDPLTIPSIDCNLLPSTVDGSFQSCVSIAQDNYNGDVTCGGWYNVAPTSADTWDIPISSNNYVTSNIIASPDGGVFAGGIARFYDMSNPGVPEAFSTTITNLIPGVKYQIKFYQSNMTMFISNNVTGSVRWKVTFGDEIQNSGNAIVQQSPTWSEQSLIFTATSANQNLIFTAVEGTIIGNYDYLYAVIDGIKITRNDFDCNAICDYCASFNLIKNEKYLVSAWVKESNLATPQEQSKSYDKGCISVSFIDIAGVPITTPKKFYATGEIIDGWQRIIGEFVVPNNVDDMKLELVNENSESKMAYFDDIRILPSKGNMKSFVYDQKTQRLMAELDENNYSTFYEYDLEGGLVRIKKETEKGVFTIQETRSGNTKSNKP